MIRRPQIAQSLPVFSPVACRLLGMVSQERVSFREIGDLIQMDAALCVDVLRLANSPLYARGGEITGILRALALLGTEAVRGIVLTVALRNFSRQAASVPAFKRCWRHNLACALLSADLAKVEMMDHDATYSFGLLHDAGRLALLAASPVAYNRLLEGGAPDSKQMLVMERELFEMDHCELGLWLAQEWQLPSDFGEAMSRHHDPGSESGGSSTMIVHLACELADMAGFAAWGPPKKWDSTELLRHLPDAGPDILSAEHLIPRLADRINSLEGTLLH